MAKKDPEDRLDDLEAALEAARARGVAWMEAQQAKGIRPLFGQEARDVLDPIVAELNREVPGPSPLALRCYRLYQQVTRDDVTTLRISLWRTRRGCKAEVVYWVEGFGGDDRWLFLAPISTPKQLKRFQDRLAKAVRKYDV